MFNLKYIKKVFRSCKTIDNCQVTADWAYNLVQKSNLTDKLTQMYTIDRFYNEMVEYINRRNNGNS